VRAATRAELRHSIRIMRRSAAPVAVSPQLAAIAQCESGGDPTAIGGGGLYRGKYQFSVGTWQSVGGTGDPAAAPEAEQDKRAAMLLARDGAGQWPVCGA
jgi:transglycosylase-like protein